MTLSGKKPPTMRSNASPHASKGALRVIPLGGMCEIGKNMIAYEYGTDIIIVDCGQVFPDETMPGVDAVIPDFTYILENWDRVRGIFITHGHEDHIGGLPYLLSEMQAPVYGGRMTVELLKYKLDDKVPGLTRKTEMHTVNDGEVIRAGCFSVEFIHVNHSIADAFITHCGMNSASEGLYYQVPLVLFPQTPEQGAVAKRTEELGAGIMLESISEKDILHALTEVLTDHTYKDNAIRISDSFHACGGVDEARAFLEEIIS